jgi:hypothetical protein
MGEIVHLQGQEIRWEKSFIFSDILAKTAGHMGRGVSYLSPTLLDQDLRWFMVFNRHTDKYTVLRTRIKIISCSS